MRGYQLAYPKKERKKERKGAKMEPSNEDSTYHKMTPSC
jgi:hypothetical protein